jgi:hypothetical protein
MGETLCNKEFAANQLTWRWPQRRITIPIRDELLRLGELIEAEEDEFEELEAATKAAGVARQ